MVISIGVEKLKVIDIVLWQLLQLLTILLSPYLTVATWQNSLPDFLSRTNVLFLSPAGQRKVIEELHEETPCFVPIVLIHQAH